MSDINTDDEFKIVEDDSGNRAISVRTGSEATDDETKVSVTRPIRPLPPKPPVAKAASTQPTPIKAAPVKATAKAAATDDPIVIRTQQWTKYIVEDLNPLLVKTSQQFCGIPDEWMNGKVAVLKDAKGNEVTFWDPPLKEKLALSQKDAQAIAKAAAQFSISPMGQVIVAWMTANQQLIAMASAMYVAGMYGYHLMQTKQQVDQLKTLMEQQQKMAAEQQTTSEVANAA